MPRLTRKNIKVFAGSATNNGVFGSLQANNPITTSDVEQLQSLSAWSEGWNAATETSEELPPLEEIQGVEYVTTYQQAYIMQEGIPEWASSVTYYKGCLTKEVTSNGFRIYNSLTDNNIGNSLSDTSNWKKVMDSADLYAFDNTVVHKTGDETIGGTKTFTSNVKVSKTAPYVDLCNTNITKGTVPSSLQIAHNAMTDKDGKFIAMTQYQYNTAGETQAVLRAYNPNNETDFAQVSIWYPPTGVPYTSAPTPSAGDNSTKIATTAFVQSSVSTKANDNAVVHLSGNETISGHKIFTNDIDRNVNAIRGQTPSTASYSDIKFVDNNNNWLAGLEYTLFTDKSSIISLIISDSVGDTTNVKGRIQLGVYSDGNVYTTAPASDVNGSIVTTISKSKSANGHFQLGNGLIIQWGTLSSGKTITYSTPFTSANSYALVFNNNATTDGYGRGDKIESKTSTSATVDGLCENPIRWIAIGY